MAKTKLENLRLGIFVILGIILLLFAAYLIGNRQNMFSKTFEISAVFKNATGLQNGNNVRFSGINVGTVNSIEMINDTTIRVRMIIQDEMRNYIKKDAIASIGTNGLVGSMIINIIPGSGTSSLISAGDELQSSNKIGTQDMMSTLNVTNENAALLTAIEIEKMAQNLNSIIGGINEGNGAINYLTRDSVFVNQLERSIENIEQGTERFNENMEALKHNFLTRGYFRKLEKKEKKNSN